MTTSTRALTALAASAVLTLGLAGAQPPDRNPPPPPAAKDTGQKVGQTIDRAASSIREGVRDTADSLRAGFARARASVHAMEVQSRVYSRLHWDKALADVNFDLTVDRDGVAIVKGEVRDIRAKARALDLASETVGVTRVVDQLTLRPVSPAETTTPVTPAAKP
jgi:hyperosmotically inducible protein